MSAHERSTVAGLRLPGRSLRRRRPSLLVRWRGFWKAAELDQALAAGSDPLASEALLWRAEQLVEAKLRRGFAEALERIVDEVARGGPQMLPGPQLIRRDVIRDNRSLLLVLAERLRSDGPQALRGLAKVDLLVSYQDSALYRGPSALTLKLELLDVLAALDPNDGRDRAQF
jgi:hypothetical protein